MTHAPNPTKPADTDERLLRRAEHLDQADRLLLDQVLVRGIRPRELATLRGTTARSIQRRVRALIGRLRHPATIYLLRRGGYWDAVTRQVALHRFIRGWPLRRISTELGLSLHEVRRATVRARGLIDVGLALQQGSRLRASQRAATVRERAQDSEVRASEQHRITGPTPPRASAA